jgi:imidazolonepropionase-like amidohydrolase
MKKLAFCIVVVSLVATASAQSRAVVYDGARLIVGDGSEAIERGTFVVQNSHITAVGNRGAVTVPAGAVRVDLTGKTVMPAMINVHVHIGYEGYTSWGAQNYTAANVLDH